MREAPAHRIDPEPASGRVFAASRVVRVAGASPGGRLRLDAVADLVQDVAGDDLLDAGIGGSAWVVRRAVIVQEVPGAFGERLALRTWCSGLGTRWAERRVSFRGDRGAVLESVSLWVHVDVDTGRAISVPSGFEGVYGPSAAGRQVSSRFQHDPDVPAGPGPVARGRWLSRYADFDVMGHVNNAVTWTMIEQAVVDHGGRFGGRVRAELEYRLPIERDDRVAIVARRTGEARLGVWVLDAGDDARVFATALVDLSRWD